MARAQQRDASVSNKFFFRKDVYTNNRSANSSVGSSSGSNTPNGSFKKKEKKLRNCFPPPPLPEKGFVSRVPVCEEYEEMTMNEIMNGKVCFPLRRSKSKLSLLFHRVLISQGSCLWLMHTSTHWRLNPSIWKKFRSI